MTIAETQARGRIIRKGPQPPVVVVDMATGEELENMFTKLRPETANERLERRRREQEEELVKVTNDYLNETVKNSDSTLLFTAVEEWPCQTTWQGTETTRANADRFRPLYEKDHAAGLFTIRSAKTARIIFQKKATSKNKHLLEHRNHAIGHAVVLAMKDGKDFNFAMLDGAKINLQYSEHFSSKFDTYAAQFSHCSMRGCTIRVSGMLQAHFDHCDLYQAEIEGHGEFYNCRFDYCNLQRAHLEIFLVNPNMHYCNMKEAKIGSILHGDIEDCYLVGTRYPYSKITKTNIRHCALQSANFENAIISARFAGCNLTFASFEEASAPEMEVSSCVCANVNIQFENDGFPSTQALYELGDCGPLAVIGRAMRSDGHEYILMTCPLGGAVIRAGCRTWQSRNKNPKYIGTMTSITQGAFGKAMKHCRNETSSTHSEEAVEIIRFLFALYKNYMKNSYNWR